MAFISAETFMAPLKNKVHLVSICMIAAVFGVYRLSSGGISVKTQPPAQPTQAVQRPVVSEPQTRRVQQQAAPARSEQIDSLLKKPERSAPSEAPRRSKLDDIEQTLGLR